MYGGVKVAHPPLPSSLTGAGDAAPSSVVAAVDSPSPPPSPPTLSGCAERLI